jgi:hypothetical protein
MPFLESYPVRAQGPRTDLSFAYLNATINNATVTVNASETTAGYSISRTTNGVYAITFKKCRFVQIRFVWLPVNAAGDRSLRLLAGIDPTAGTATLEISATLTGAAADPAAAANELELQFLSGF